MEFATGLSDGDEVPRMIEEETVGALDVARKVGKGEGAKLYVGACEGEWLSSIESCIILVWFCVVSRGPIIVAFEAV